mmetsp:Transcript_52492/g.149782  ORF Transcript_52492/g.149782 Transcript_52492/m.149782 type:complete len:518 (-) Transcript_52492:82-1635(-)
MSSPNRATNGAPVCWRQLETASACHTNSDHGLVSVSLLATDYLGLQRRVPLLLPSHKVLLLPRAYGGRGVGRLLRLRQGGLRRREPTEQQGRADHEERGARHADARDEGRYVQRGVEQARGHGQAEEVEAEGPEEVEQDGPEGGPAEGQERHAVPQLRANERHVCGFHCYVRTHAEGHADVRLRQGWGVVHAVADEAHPARPLASPPWPLQLRDALALGRRQRLGHHVPDPHLGRDALGGGSVVASAHPDLRSERPLHVADHPRGLLADRVLQGHCAQRHAVDVQQDDYVALLLHAFHPLQELLIGLRRLLWHGLHEVRQIPDPGGDAAQLTQRAPHAPASGHLEVLRCCEGRQAGDLLRGGQHAPGDGMVAGTFEAAQDPPEAVFQAIRTAHVLRADQLYGRPGAAGRWSAPPFGRSLRRAEQRLPGLLQRREGLGAASGGPDTRLALGDGSRLVQDHDVQSSGHLQGLRALHQAAALRCETRRDHHRHWGCQAHRTRAGNHQNGDPEFHSEQQLK